MQVAEPWVEGERATQRDADPDRRQPADHEEDEGGVDDEDRVGERAAQSCEAPAGFFAGMSAAWNVIVIIERSAKVSGTGGALPSG